MIYEMSSPSFPDSSSLYAVTVGVEVVDVRALELVIVVFLAFGEHFGAKCVNSQFLLTYSCKSVYNCSMDEV